MRNDGAATMAGEFSDIDIEKQQIDGVADGGHGLADNAVGQSQDLVEKIIDVVVVECPNKGEPQLERDSTSHEECRVCQEESEEVLINRGCQCRGGLAKEHQSCIIKWFNTRGSNKCEICQQVAANVVPPDSQTSYWVWRVDPALRAQDCERSCFSPLWVAFSILVGGLLLDVLISVTLGVSALHVNIIIGVICCAGTRNSSSTWPRVLPRMECKKSGAKGRSECQYRVPSCFVGETCIYNRDNYKNYP